MSRPSSNLWGDILLGFSKGFMPGKKKSWFKTRPCTGTGGFSRELTDFELYCLFVDLVHLYYNNDRCCRVS
ncbi:hypothetical protein [Chroococcidiopsis cubana]|uniref:hypothetical protein n=1 Tax=Chroococcidiopsis cubana TaxID=171392 RepID=UPI0038FD3C7D